MKLDPNAREQEVLKLWKDQNLFQQVQNLRKKSPPFVLFEGPPTANGKPGIHHVLTRTFKDAIARFKTMQGRYVERKAGWDEHGLPVELEVQKQLKLNTKQDIIDYGVQKFNDACQESTRKFIRDWEELTERMGYWLDFEKAYRTSDPKYIHQVWIALENLLINKDIYEDYKIVPWACDSQTVLANAELEYKEVEQSTLTVKFRIADETNTHLLAWTTTPWTLPANMALAVNPDLTYYESVDPDRDFRFISSIKNEFSLPISGKKLVGLKYRHPFTNKICSVLAADFVTEGVGTGIVHIAPAYGADDYALWQKQNSDEKIIQHVNSDGSFNSEAPECLKDINLLAKNFEVANGKITEFCEEKDLLFVSNKTKHEYPHNWRTGKPLIYTLRKSWFIRTSKMPLAEANEKVTWYPEHIKEGRFGQWLKGGKDWAISRERFWGTPLPFYRSNTVVAHFYPPAHHKPASDRSFAPRWGDKEVWQKTPEVLDCWFDSGAMPFAAYDKPLKADVICEGIDQTRGWFYSLMVIGVGLTDSSPYKAAICLGHVLDKNGHKMSKSKKNSVDPWEVFEREGADAVRWYMLKHTIGNPILWNEAEVKKVNQVFFNRILNCVSFFEQQKGSGAELTTNNATDNWIFIRLKNATQQITEYMETYQFSKATETLELFVDDLSNVWLRTNRPRFLNSEFKIAHGLLRTCLMTIAQLIAPFCPMLAENIWQRTSVGSAVCSSKSVHLTDWPAIVEFGKKKILDDMIVARQVVSEGLKIRDKNQIRLRQPLNSVKVPKSLEVANELLPFVQSELNIKEVFVGDYENVELDLVISEELVAEGMIRDLTRTIQSHRKDLDLKRGDPIQLTLDMDDKTKEMLKDHMEALLSNVSCVELIYGTVPNKNTEIGVEVKKHG